MPDMADLHPGDFYRPEVVAGPTKVFVGYDGGTPVATAAAHSAAGVTVVENVAVLASARGQGAGAALTWAATTAWPGQASGSHRQRRRPARLRAARLPAPRALDLLASSLSPHRGRMPSAQWGQRPLAARPLAWLAWKSRHAA